MASAIDQSVAMLESLHDETRSLVMRWAVNTAALQDLIKRTGQPELPFPEVAQIATRWLEQHSKRTGEFATPREAADRASMSIQQLALGRPPELSRPRSQPPLGRLDAFDRKLSLFMQRYGFFMLRMSLGIVFFWFGALKPFRLSPADDLVEKTVFWLPGDVFIPILGVWEMAIGLGLMIRPLARVALLLLFLQMPGTALPLLLLPDVCFTVFPYGLTLEGQYIIKNLTLISAAIVVGGTVRHGKTRAEQEKVTWMV